MNPPSNTPPPDPGATQPLPPGYVPPPGYPPQMPGYPQGYPPQMPQGYPPGYAPPPGYPPGYAPPPGYGPPPGYPAQMPGYPAGYPMPPGAPAMPVVAPPPSPAPAPAAAVAPAMPAPSSPMPVPAASGGGVPSDAAEAVSVVAHAEGEVFHPPALTHIEVGPEPNQFVKMWRKVGGSALLMSILIHVGLGILALFVVFQSGVLDKEVDFLPGGGTAQGQAASQDLQHKVQQKKRSSISKTMPMKKLVTTSMNSAITLPEAPPDALDMPDVSAMLGGGALGASGGFGMAGAEAALARGLEPAGCRDL